MTPLEMLEILRRNPVALSVRQPWPHRMFHEGKDVENRDWRPGNPGLRFRGPVLIHAGLLADEGEVVTKDMPRGGIVGMVEIVDCVTKHPSRWFFGRYGLVLQSQTPLAFLPCKGALGFFRPTIDPALLQLLELPS